MEITIDEARLLLNLIDKDIIETKDNLLLQALKQVKEKIKNIICYGKNI